MEENRNASYYMEALRKMNEGKAYAACVVTYGCQQNEADSERIAGMLHESGYDIVKEPALADVIVVNTCAVREHAEERALSITGGYKHLKAARPHLKIGVCGCMVSKADMSDKIKKSYPYIDFVFGTEKLSHLPENAGQLAFFAEVADAKRLERFGILALPDGLQRRLLQFEHHFSHRQNLTDKKISLRPE